jgi:predicted dehydrogenase
VGKRAGAFVAGFLAVPGVRIVAVGEADPGARAALAARAGVTEADTYADFDDLLSRARPEAVAIGTPMHLHVPQSVAALDDGRHVLCEVTAAVNLDECRTLAASARRAGRVSGVQYMMAENANYRGDLVLVRTLAQSGRFGRVYFAEGEYIHDVKHLHRTADGTPTWRATWQVGRRGATYATHSLGPVLECFGPEARVAMVSCHGSGAWSDPSLPHDDTCLMTCQVEGGGLIKVRLDMMSNRPHEMSWYAVQGTHGAYEAARAGATGAVAWFGANAPDPRNERRWGSLADHEGALPEWMRGPVADEARAAGHGGGDFWVAHQFATAILEGRPVPIGIERALAYTVPGLVSEASIAAGGVPMPVPAI